MRPTWSATSDRINVPSAGAGPVESCSMLIELCRQARSNLTGQAKEAGTAG
jgi:hypothetical protein